MSDTNPAHGEHAVHAVPLRILVGTWAALVVLTVVTVAATYIDLGSLNILLALAIAVVKSTVVAMYFMHLRYDKPFHSVVFVSATLFVALFISLALIDTKEYAPSKIPAYAPELQVPGAALTEPGDAAADGPAEESGAVAH